MFKFEYYDEEWRTYTSMELRKDDLTHDYVAERFTEFLRGCGYVFDAMAQHRLVDDSGNVLPNFEERYQKVMEEVRKREGNHYPWDEPVDFGDTANEDGQGTFPVI